MADNILYHGPLDHFDIPHTLEAAQGKHDAIAVLEECGFRGQVVLRGDVKTLAFQEPVENILGFRLPVEPTTASGGAGFPRVLWLGPEEWLIVTQDADSAMTVARLDEALVGQHVQVVDVSDARAIFNISGISARKILTKGCPLDLHPRVFTAGHSTRTVIGKVQIILHQVSERPDYDIYVHRSLAEYLWEWLEDAGLEYGIQVVRD